MGAVLHDDAVAGGLSAHPFEPDNVGVVELAQVVDLSLRLVLDLLDGHQFVVELADEHGALGPGTKPLQVGDRLEGHLPFV